MQEKTAYCIVSRGSGGSGCYKTLLLWRRVVFDRERGRERERDSERMR